MNRDIIELREVIKKLVPLLSGKGLAVTQRGSQAYVQTDPKTKQPLLVNIPNIPDNASSDFVAAISGFIDHEVAHVLHTNWNWYGGKGGMSESDLKNPKKLALMNMHNIVEDVMIEREQIKVFPGSERNLSVTRRWFLEKITEPALKGVKDEKEQFRYILVPMMRALGGHQEMQEWMDKKGYWSHTYVAELLKLMKPATVELLKKATTTEETFKIAQEVQDILTGNIYPEPPAPPSASSKSKDKPEKKAGEGDGDGERNHSDQDPGKDGKSENSEGGKDDSETDKSGSSKKAKSSPKKEDDDGEDDGERSGDSEDAGDDAGSDAGDQTDDDAGDDGDAANGSEGSDDSEDEEDSSGESSSGEDEDGDDGEKSGRRNEVSAVVTAGDEGGGESADGSDEEHQGGGGGVGNAMSKSLFDYEDDDFEKVDMSAQIAIKITKAAVEAMNPSEYTVFTRDADEIKPVEVPSTMNSKWVPEMEEETASMTAKMQKDIERAMASQSHVIRTPGHKNGKLHAPSLFRVMQGDPRVFTQKQEHVSKDTAVSVVIDNSGSMGGHKMSLAMTAGYALCSTLERVKIANEVIGFTTGGFYGLSDSIRRALEIEQKSKARISYDRISPLVLPIYKTFDERLSAPVKARFAFMKNAQPGLAGNVDGESLQYCAERLLKRSEKRKVMLVLSDGQPAGGHKSGPHLKHVVEQLGKIGIECIGIGIMDDSVSKFYPKYTVLKKAEDLPGQVMTEIKRILIGA